MSLALDSASPTAVYSGIMFYMVSGREKIECVVAASALLARARIKSLSPYGLLACFRKYAAEVEAAALDKYARGEFDRLGRLIVDDLAPARSRAARTTGKDGGFNQRAGPRQPLKRTSGRRSPQRRPVAATGQDSQGSISLTAGSAGAVVGASASGSREGGASGGRTAGACDLRAGGVSCVRTVGA